MIESSKAQRRTLALENAKRPETLQEVRRADLPAMPHGMVRVLRSRRFSVQVYEAPAPALARLSIHRTVLDGRTKRWLEGITWEEIQTLKRECGYADLWAVEVYPPDAKVVNVANMRHVWLLPPEMMSFAWQSGDMQP